MKITILYNIPGTSTTPNIEEADNDTLVSANEVRQGLINLGHEVELFGITANEIEKIKNISTDMVFNLVEWSGRECDLGVKVCEELEKSEVPFTGSRAWGYRLSCNKILMKQVFSENNIPTPKWQILYSKDDKLDLLPYPAIAKPTLEHCAIGISQKSVVENENELKMLVNELVDKYQQPVLVEEYIEGMEGHITILEKKGAPWVLPPALIAFNKHDGYKGILTYEVKWKEKSWEDELSVWVEDEQKPDLIQKINDVAVKCYLTLGGRSYPRVDIRIRGGEVYVLEINNNPGIDFNPASGICRSAVKVGLTWETLLDNIIKEAL